jgi:hypothetical protein
MKNYNTQTEFCLGVNKKISDIYRVEIDEKGDVTFYTGTSKNPSCTTLRHLSSDDMYELADTLSCLAGNYQDQVELADESDQCLDDINPYRAIERENCAGISLGGAL